MAEDQLLEDIMRAELCAEDVLTDKQTIIDLDKRRNKTREALRALRNDKTNDKSWVCFGNMFLKLSKTQSKQFLEKDYDNLDTEINKLRVNLKPKVDSLRKQEHEDELKGFQLQPLSKEELRSLEDVL